MYQRILLPNYKICRFSHLSRIKPNTVQFYYTLSFLLCKLELWPFLILIAQRGIKSLPISLPAVSLRDLSGHLYGPNHHILLIPKTIFIDFCLQNPYGTGKCCYLHCTSRELTHREMKGSQLEKKGQIPLGFGQWNAWHPSSLSKHKSLQCRCSAHVQGRTRKT